MMDKLKKNWSTLMWAVAVIATLYGAFTWAADAKKKLDAVEQIQLAQSEMQKDILRFVMDLWQIDPNTRHKWAKLNWKPEVEKNGDTLAYVDWYSVENLNCIVHYEVRKDSTKKHFLWVDTIYKYCPGDSL